MAHGRRRLRPTGGEQAAEEAGGPRDPEEAARSICLRMLTLQPRTRAELSAALAERGIAAEAVLGRFTEVGLIDDAAFAQAWVDTRHRGRGLGRRALAQELGRRGIDRDTAGEALEQLDADTEEATARALVERRLPSLRRHDRVVRVRRLVGMLARKGYPPGLAARVVRTALAAESVAEDTAAAESAADTVADVERLLDELDAD